MCVVDNSFKGLSTLNFVWNTPRSGTHYVMTWYVPVRAYVTGQVLDSYCEDKVTACDPYLARLCTFYSK